jgi:DNA mismatch repair protein MutL
VILENIVPELAQNGFEVEPFGPKTIAITTAPAILKGGAVEKLLRELLDGLERETQVMNIEALKRKIAATVSCHAAIKINTPLDETKMRWLVGELMKTDVPTVCPHGRPIILRYDLREIERAFKRAQSLTDAPTAFIYWGPECGFYHWQIEKGEYEWRK